MPLGLALISAAFEPDRRGRALGIYFGVDRARGRERPGRRRRDRRGPRVGVDLLDQRPARDRADPVRAAPAAREPRAGHRRSTSPASRSSPARRSASSGASCAATRPAGAASRSIGSFAAGAAADGRVRGWELRTPDPMLPMRFWRSRAFTGGQRVGVLLARRRSSARCSSSPSSSRRGLGYGAARRRPAAAAVDADAVLRRAGRGRARRPLRRAAVHGRRADAAGDRHGLDRADRRSRGWPTAS